MHEEVRKAINLREGGDPGGAGSLLSAFLRENPGDAEARYQMAWTLDIRGMEREAIPHYRLALENGLSGGDRGGALLSLGSSLRAIGEYDEWIAEHELFGEEGFSRARSLIETYKYLPGFGIADASNVVLAERYEAFDILTTDQRDFREVVGSQGRRFRILPYDL